MDKVSKSITDLELIREFTNGNDLAFAVLLDRHKSKIFTTVFLIVKDREVAEDIFQDAMLKVVSKIREGEYKEEGKFVPWAARIARNLAIDHYRRDKRYTMVHDNGKFDIFDYVYRSDTNEEKKIIIEENSRYVRAMIQQLPAKQRDVLIMRHYGEMSFKQISELQNVSINTALGRMRYALVNLRRMNQATDLVDDKKKEEKLRLWRMPDEKIEEEKLTAIIIANERARIASLETEARKLKDGRKKVR